MTHPGTVLKTQKGQVTVQITSVSACAACQAHANCGFAESKTKTLDIPDRHWADYHEGEQVTVTIDHSHGLLAVLIAYLLPALLLLGVIVALSLARLPELAVILISFAALALYILLLLLLRRRINSRFTLKVQKTNPSACSAGLRR